MPRNEARDGIQPQHGSASDGVELGVVHHGVARNLESGRVAEALLELLILITVVPPVVCCVLRTALAFVGIIVPWLALVMITALVCACLGALAVSRRQLPPADPRAVPPPVLHPIRRPPAIPDRSGRFDRHGD